MVLVSRVKVLSCILFGVVLSLIAGMSSANGGGEGFKEGINYIPIKPGLVVNYGGVGRVRYIKAEISMRVEDIHAAEEVAHNMPVIRDTLIMLLSSMTEEQVSSGEGKELMRQQALVKVNEALESIERPAPETHSDAKKIDKPKKDEKPRDEKSKKEDKSKQDEHKKPLVSDLLFDNLVVQR